MQLEEHHRLLFPRALSHRYCQKIARGREGTDKTREERTDGRKDDVMDLGNHLAQFRTWFYSIAFANVLGRISFLSPTTAATIIPSSIKSSKRLSLLAGVAPGVARQQGVYDEERASQQGGEGKARQGQGRTGYSAHFPMLANRDRNFFILA